MQEQLQKICSIWLTENTLQKYFAKENIVKDVENIQKIDENSLFLKYVEDGIDIKNYEVYARNKKVYNKYMEKFYFKDFYYE